LSSIIVHQLYPDAILTPAVTLRHIDSSAGKLSAVMMCDGTASQHKFYGNSYDVRDFLLYVYDWE
jgi:hypothetical protein